MSMSHSSMTTPLIVPPENLETFELVDGTFHLLKLSVGHGWHAQNGIRVGAGSGFFHCAILNLALQAG
jgi:hypothetical protein